MKSIYYAYASLFGRPPFARINKLMYSLALRGLGIYNYQDTRVSGESWFINHILKQAGEHLVIFDVGANIGSYSKQILLSGVSVEKIYAFEPHVITYQKLIENVADHPIQAVNLGLSDNIGVSTLYDRASSNGSSHASLSSAIFSEVHCEEAESTQIQLTTVDEFSKLSQIECIDLLKIDVEGYEINVLRGAEKMIKAGNVRFIQFEFTQLNSTIGVFFKDFYDLLGSRYAIYRLLPHGVEPIKTYNPTFHEIFGYQNFVCRLTK